MPKRVLIVCTSAERYGSTDEKTGLWMEELVAPYNAFESAGYEVAVASIKGGEIPVDETSLNPPFVNKEVEDFILSDERMKSVLESPALSAMKVDDFDAFFLAGGHGTCYDFPNDAKLIALLEAAEAAGKVIAAVCHGPNGLVNIRTSSGDPLVKGKQVTGFSNDEEYAVAKEDLVPFLLEDKLKELGGVYSKAAEKWAAYAVRDGRLVTGQNPASSLKTAQLLIEALS